MNGFQISQEALHKKAQNFIPKVREGCCVKVYDSDTITINTCVQQGVVEQFHVRINGIDAPEKKSKIEKEKQVCKQTTTWLESMILHKTVELKNVSLDKYGRLLADVIIKDSNINVSELLLEKKLVLAYGGKTKSVFTVQFLDNAIETLKNCVLKPSQTL